MGRGAVIQCLGRNDSKESHMSGSINLTRIFFVKWTGYCTHIYWQIESGVVPREPRTTATAARWPALGRPLKRQLGAGSSTTRGHTHLDGRGRRCQDSRSPGAREPLAEPCRKRSARAGLVPSAPPLCTPARQPLPFEPQRPPHGPTRLLPSLESGAGCVDESPLVARGPVPCR